MTLGLNKPIEALRHWVERALHSPFGFQFVVMVFFVLFIGGFRPVYISGGTGTFFGDESFVDQNTIPISEEGFFDNYAHVKTAGFEEVLVEGEDGETIVQIMPQKRTELVKYSVRSGDNISKIAHKFGLKVSTVLWANKFTSKETLQPNQEIIIPPTDGIFYEVRSGEVLGEIVKAHDADMTKVLAYNRLDEKKTIQVGQRLFLPDASKVFVPQKPNRVVNNQRPSTTNTSTGGTQLQSLGFKLLRPTKGILTQGYIRGHYALDIANSLNTPIYASADGVVKISKDGWNYGYGNYIVLDHGNGVETLYSHFNTRAVQVGDVVKRGQRIGGMGNSGRVFGVTGIHLHFELRINGRKVNPNNYF